MKKYLFESIDKIVKTKFAFTFPYYEAQIKSRRFFFQKTKFGKCQIITKFSPFLKVNPSENQYLTVLNCKWKHGNFVYLRMYERMFKMAFMFISNEKIWICKLRFILILEYFHNFAIIILQLLYSEPMNYSVLRQFKILVISLKFILQRTFKPLWFKCSLPLCRCCYFTFELSVIKFYFFPHFWKLYFIIKCFYS